MTTEAEESVPLLKTVPRARESAEHPTPESSATGLLALETRLARAEEALSKANAKLAQQRPTLADVALQALPRLLGNRSGRAAALVVALGGPAAVSVSGLTVANEVEALAQQQLAHDRLLLLFGEVLVLSLEHQQAAAEALARGEPPPEQGERLTRLRRQLAALQSQRELDELVPHPDP